VSRSLQNLTGIGEREPESRFSGSFFMRIKPVGWRALRAGSDIVRQRLVCSGYELSMSIWKIIRIGVVALAVVVLSSVRGNSEPAAIPQPGVPAKTAATSDVAVPSAPRAAQIEPMAAPVKREAPVAPQNKAKSAVNKKPVRSVSANTSSKPPAKSVQKNTKQHNH
jgi:hypothetical protein